MPSGQIQPQKKRPKTAESASTARPIQVQRAMVQSANAVPTAVKGSRASRIEATSPETRLTASAKKRAKKAKRKLAWMTIRRWRGLKGRELARQGRHRSDGLVDAFPVAGPEPEPGCDIDIRQLLWSQVQQRGAPGVGRHRVGGHRDPIQRLDQGE